MKIKLLTLAAITVGILAINSAHAESCEGGTLRTGDNGHEYCQSNREMNWWSAYSWCEAQGLKLPSAYDLCPSWDGSGVYQCGMLYLGTVWTSTAYENNKAMLFSESGGEAHIVGNASRTTRYKVVCIKK